MKFLCVACDEPMKLEKTERPQQGTITALFECPECFTQVAMLTNPSETQMIQSLGVKIGPATNGETVAAHAVAANAVAANAGAANAGAANAGAAKAESKCPFAGVLSQVEAQPAAQPSATGAAWTPEALARLANIPEFVRPMAKQGIEQFALAEGRSVIDEGLLDQARGKFGM
jgi:hypothetical protein